MRAPGVIGLIRLAACPRVITIRVVAVVQTLSINGSDPSPPPLSTFGTADLPAFGGLPE